MKIDITRIWTKAALLDHLGSLDAGATLEFIRPPKAKTGSCWCGCGATTKGGKFAPGHDSKFHSLAKQIARGLATVTQEDLEETLPCEEAIADLRHHIAIERPLHLARVAAAEKLKADKASAKAAVKTVTETLEDTTKTEETAEADVDAILAGMV